MEIQKNLFFRCKYARLSNSLLTHKKDYVNKVTLIILIKRALYNAL